MREMLKEFEEKPNSDNREDRLELHNLSPKERRAAKKAAFNEKIADMTPSQKASYIFSYYKWWIIGTITAILLITSLSYTVYKNSRPLSISYVVINNKNFESFDSSYIDKYTEDMGMTDGYRMIATLDYELTFEEYEKAQNSSETTIYSKYPMECYNGYYDIAITDEEGLQYCAMQDIYYHVDNVLDADIYNVVKDRVYIATDHSGDEQEFAIDISDTEFAKSMNLSYDKVYLAFPGATTANLTSAKRLVRYIFDIPVEE